MRNKRSRWRRKGKEEIEKGGDADRKMRWRGYREGTKGGREREVKKERIE